MLNIIKGLAYLQVLFIFMQENNQNSEIIEISTLKNKINNLQAKKWGYKNTKEALADGMYGVVSVSISLVNLKDLLKISESDAMDLVYKWRDNGDVTFSRVCGLDEIYFSNK
jgi:hypothetical protein